MATLADNLWDKYSSTRVVDGELTPIMLRNSFDAVVDEIEPVDGDTCKWNFEEIGFCFETRCGTMFSGLPQELSVSNYKHCPKCGLEIEVEKD